MYLSLGKWQRNIHDCVNVVSNTRLCTWRSDIKSLNRFYQLHRPGWPADCRNNKRHTFSKPSATAWRLSPMRGNEWGFRPLVGKLAQLGQKSLLRMVRWVRWHCPGGLWPSTLPLDHLGSLHNIESSRAEKKHFVSLKLEGQRSNLRSPTFQADTVPGLPPSYRK